MPDKVSGCAETLSGSFRYSVRMLPLCCPDTTEMGVRMLPKYGHQKNLTPLAGALMIFADCYGVAARGLQPVFSLPAGFPLRARATRESAAKVVGRQDGGASS